MDKSCYGFDCDGVIVRIPWIFNFFGKRFEDSALRMSRFKLFRVVYNNLLKVNPDIKERMRNLKEDGHRIVIISARLEKQRGEMENFLKNKGINFDKLILRKRFAESILSYKFKMISEENCVFYWEDRERVVDYINNQAGRKLAILYPRIQNKIRLRPA